MSERDQPQADSQFSQAEALRKLKPDFDLAKDRAAAASRVAKLEGSVTDPFARFNMNLDGRNPDFAPKPETGLPAEIAPAASAELQAEVQHEQAITVETGQRINVITANWSRRDSKRPLLFMASYNSAIGDEGTRYRIQELARQTDRPVISMDHPGVGKSEALSKQQAKEVMETGYDPAAKLELAALRKMGVTEIDLTGISMGAFAIASIAKEAAAYGIEIHQVIMVETPGIEDLSQVDIAKRFLGEGSGMALAQAAPYNPEMRAKFGLNKSGLRQGLTNLRWAARIPGLEKRHRYAKTMAKNTIPDTLTAAMASQPDMEVSLAHGTTSAVSEHGANTVLASELKQKFGTRIHEAIYPGEGHAVLENVQRHVGHVRAILK